VFAGVKHLDDPGGATCISLQNVCGCLIKSSFTEQPKEYHIENILLWRIILATTKMCCSKNNSPAIHIVRILCKIGGSTNIKAYRIQPNPFFTPNPSSPTNPKKLAAKIREEILIAQAKLASKKSWHDVESIMHQSLCFTPNKIVGTCWKGVH